MRNPKHERRHDAGQVQEIKLSEGVRLKMLVGDTFISASCGIFQVNMLPQEARALGEAFLKGADELEAKMITLAGVANG